MCYRRSLYTAWDWFTNNLGPMLLWFLIGCVITILGFAIKGDIATSRRLDQYSIEHKLDPERVERFLRYNEKITKEDFMEDPYVMNLYKIYTGTK